MTKSWKIKCIALGLCAVLFGSAGFGLFGFGTSRASNYLPSAATALEDVTGQYSLDAIKQSQYNSSVQANAFPSSGSGNVIIRLEDGSVYDRYAQKARATSFSEYITTVDGSAYTDTLAKRQNKVLAAMRSEGIEYEFKYSYTALSNAVAVNVAFADVDAIRKIAGVADVYYSNTYAVPEVFVSNNNANVYSTGIYNTDGIDEKGEGMKVAVLDTGLDYTHTAFQTMPDPSNEGLWGEDDVAVNFDKLTAKERVPSLEVSDVYVSAKVPYAFDYADNDANVYPSYSSHGTHVAGIIGGQDDNKKVGEEGSDETFVGVAPQAQLVIMKVFTDNLDSVMLGGADSTDILAAVNDCAVLGVDVINMSLGTSCGFTSETTDEYLTEVYDKVNDAGISLVVAASNESSSGYGGGNGVNLASNPDSGTVGSPSTYSAALSVASINGKESPYVIANAATSESVAFITNAVDLYSHEIDFVDKLMTQFADDASVFDKNAQELTLNYVVVPGVGRNTNYSASIRRALADGKTIALVKRGDISFSEKVQNAKSAGAAGVIIYNHLSGEIRMSLAELEDPIPACSIDLNAGTAMVNNAVSSRGTITLRKDYTAGPFMSSFSSWGVTPDLRLKPEITAHGGEIFSAVPGGYDTQSGTSMAAPNMAGAVTLLRQNLKNRNRDLSGVALNALVNQRLMSTATIAMNPVGNPYSPRKQGAGLGSIKAAIHSPAYLLVPNKGEDKDENPYSDKTKIELGDDPQRTGVYTDTFTVKNISDKELTYTFSSYVFTETLAINQKTVEENAYMLNDAVVSFSTKGAVSEVTNGGEGTEVKVGAGQTADITVTVRLTDKDKAYLNDSFENGMYVEGYFRLLSTEEKNDQTNSGIDLSLPFLAFYGDWGEAPMFDYSIYELAETDADQSIEEADKPVASARETTPLGLYDDGQYIIPLGAYLYNQADEDVEIFPDEAKATVSMYDIEGRRSVYELYMVYGGLLRGAKEMDITITDTVTGEVVYTDTQYNVRKSYANSGSTVGSPINIDMRPDVWGLANNREYTLRMQGALDWGDGSANKNSFEFSFHADYEAPTIESYSVRFDPYTENKVTKYRIYLDVNVFDNQYAQVVLPCYLKDGELALLTEYAVPVYSSPNSVSKVSIEITDFYDDYYGDIYLAVEDYAMNQSLYHLNLNNATNYCSSLSFAQDGEKFMQTDVQSATTSINGQPVRYEYPVYSLALQPNEAYTLVPTATPTDTYSYKLDWSSSYEGVASAYENQIFAKKSGTAIVSVKDGNGITKAQIRVTVAGNNLSSPSPEKLTLRPVINKNGYVQALPSGSVLELYPSTTLQFFVDVEPWYATGNTQLLWSSNNEKVLTVDENGVVTTKEKGVAFVTVRDANNSRVTATVQVRVVSGFRISNYTLYEYHGPSDVVIDDELSIMYLDEDCFAGNTEITSVVLPSTMSEIPENAFKGCTKLRSVTIPDKINVIGNGAFEGCTSLKEIVLDEFIDEEHGGDPMTGAVTAGSRAFYNCRSLTTIRNSLRLTTVGREAFAGCTSLKAVDLRGVAAAYDSAFEGCTSLEKVLFSASTHAAAYMFRGCTSLSDILYATIDALVSIDENGTITGSVQQGYPMRSVAEGMFYGCTSLAGISFDTTLYDSAFVLRIGANAFGNCTSLATLTVGAKAQLAFTGANAFGGSKLTTITANGNANHSVAGGILYDSGKTQIVLVPENTTSITLPSSVRTIGNGAFAGKTGLTSVVLTNVEKIGNYAFADTGLTSVTLPSSLTSLGAGAFQGCNALHTVTLGSNITAIPDNAFKDCVLLTSVTVPEKIVSIGNGAFKGCTSLTSVAFASGSALQSVGDSAFEGTDLTLQTLPASVKTIGNRAFAHVKSLTVFTVPAVTRMGASVFAGTRLTSLTFADGAEAVGGYVMTDTSALSNATLKTVTLPSTVKTIGVGAFDMCTALTSIDLGSVNVIGDFAFYGTAIQTAGPYTIGASVIGAMAFAETANLTRVTLPNAREIGAAAFFSSALQSVTMPKAQKIGANAFTGTRLISVTVPATLESYMSDQTVWMYKQSNGKIEEQDIFTESMGAGAFAAIETLTNISVQDGNDVYFTDNGVLYARVANGYTLVQYPTAKAGDSYEVLAGTVRIEPDAFNGVSRLKRIVMPYELKSIGARAFYNSSVIDYTFRSVAAPVLESEFVDAEGLNNSNVLYYIFGSGASSQLRSQVFYANFTDYVAKIVEEKRLNEAGVNYKATRFGLTITYPENGSGYDNLIWSAFFDTHTLSAYAPDDVTIRAINALSALPSAEQIAAVADIDALNALHEKYVATARAMYNAVVDAKQLAFITTYDDLLAAESAVRAARARFGQPATVVALKILSEPNTLRYYVGDTLDVTGLRVGIVYSDTSEEEITNYTLDKSVLGLGDSEVTVSYGNVKQTFNISVTVYVAYNVTFTGKGVRTRTEEIVSGGKVQEPTAPTRKGYAFEGWYNGDELFDFNTSITSDITLTARWTRTSSALSGGAVAGIVIAVVVVVAGGAVAVVLLLLRKRKGASAGTEQTAAAQNENGDSGETAVQAQNDGGNGDDPSQGEQVQNEEN